MNGFVVVTQARGRKVYWSDIESKALPGYVEWCWSDTWDMHRFSDRAKAERVAEERGGARAGVTVEDAPEARGAA